LPPPITVDEAADALLAQQAVTAEQLDYLDSRGNGDGVYNLGDLLAYLIRLGRVSTGIRDGPDGVDSTLVGPDVRAPSPDDKSKKEGADAIH
jgi:hypothetical protein